MQPNIASTVRRMASQADAIAALVSGLDPTEARRRPAPERWSSHEVVCHLYDEERFDFRLRIEMLFERPDEPWPPIDPEGWVVSHAYGEADPAETLAAFRAERARSIAWLEQLSAARQLDWQLGRPHPHGGSLRAIDLLASWLAHDCLHIRQLLRNRFETIGEVTGPAVTLYAGEW